MFRLMSKFTRVPISLLTVCLLAWSLASAGCATPNHEIRYRAARAIHQGDLAEAESHLRQALKQKPADWQAHLMLGEIQLERDEPLAAQGSFERAWSLRPDHERTPEILDLLAEAIYRQDQPETLYQFLDEQAQRYGQPRDYLRQSFYLRKMGDHDAAELALRKAFAFSQQDNVSVHLAAADFYETIGDEPRAILSLRRAYTLEPDDPEIQQRLRALGVIPGPTIRVSEEQMGRPAAERG